MTRPKEFSSEYLLNIVKNSATCISFPSLYFDGYFPHLAPMNGLTSILLQAHDYVIAYCSTIKLSKNKIHELIESKDLYPYDLSKKLVEDSFNALEVREQEDKIDIKISNYLRKNYLKHKLFNQFRHPKRPVFSYLANMILSNIDRNPYKFEDHIEYLDSVVAPIYKSTYLNLSLGFDESFEHYKTITGKFVHQTVVIEEFLTFYGQFQNVFLRRIIEQKKPFVPRIVEEWLTK